MGSFARDPPSICMYTVRTKTGTKNGVFSLIRTKIITMQPAHRNVELTELNQNRIESNAESVSKSKVQPQICPPCT